jgi:hypothetical protein
MNRKLLPVATVLMWLALPPTALNYRRNWERLPARMAVHFDINWQPNGWTSPEISLRLALTITAFLVVVFTIASYGVSRARVSNWAVWTMLAFFYAVLGLVYFVNAWVVERNLREPRAAQTRSIVFRVSSCPLSLDAEVLKLDS